LYGQYLFADVCSGRIWRAAPAGEGWEVVLLGEFHEMVAPSVIGEAANGELYVGSYQHQYLYHITAP
jgi:hypothetical protein